MIDGYDAALFDLDGVVYLGPAAVPGAADGIRALRERGVRTGFVTNNAARPPAAVAAHLRELGIPCEDSDVVTSAQAGAQVLLERFGPKAPVLVVGGAGVRAALEEVGLVGVTSADDHPVAVIQGWGVDLTWEQLNEAAIAIQRGAHWLATNTDSTRPTDRGLVPGNGAAVAAVRTAVDATPEVAGKPYRPLLDVTVKRLGATRPLFLGDRLDTDIAGARNAGLDSMFVLTGAHGVRDLLVASTEARPTYLGYDLRDLLRPARQAEVGDLAVRCGRITVTAAAGRVVVQPTPSDLSEQTDALWAAAHLAWSTGSVDPATVLTATPQLPAGTH